MLAFFLFVGHKRILPFEMVLKGSFQGTCQYREVPLVETLPPPVSSDRALALVGPLAVSPPGFDPPIGQVLINTPVGGISCEDPLPFDMEEDGTSTRSLGRLTKLRAYSYQF